MATAAGRLNSSDSLDSDRNDPSFKRASSFNGLHYDCIAIQGYFIALFAFFYRVFLDDVSRRIGISQIQGGNQSFDFYGACFTLFHNSIDVKSVENSYTRIRVIFVKHALLEQTELC